MKILRTIFVAVFAVIVFGSGLTTTHAALSPMYSVSSYVPYASSDCNIFVYDGAAIVAVHGTVYTYCEPAGPIVASLCAQAGYTTVVITPTFAPYRYADGPVRTTYSTLQCSRPDPTGTVSASSNISSSWTITGPATITGSGTSQTSASQPIGVYTITWGAVTGYATPASQSLTLTSEGTISFSGNYSLNSYTVSATAGAGGTISPASISVNHGNTTTFTVIPNTGYTAASVTGCGGSLSGNSYTTGVITAACTVSATYSGNSCTLPWGGSIASGNSATAYQSASVVSPATCTSQSRTCTNGSLSGTYTNSGCTVTAALAIPTVTTPTATSITTTGATLGANVTSLGNPATITARGTCLGTAANPTTNCLAETGTTTGIFTHARTGLTANTTYYYRGYADNSTGRGYSADGTFTTNMDTPTPPIISGPTTLRAGQSGTYSFVATDPQGQQVSYAVDWNSNGTDLWMPYGSVPPLGGMTYVNSGESQSASNSWATPGTYTVKVLAQNKVGGLNSVWTTYTVTVTCANNTINPPTCTQCDNNIAYVNGSCVFCSTGGCSGTPGGNSTNFNSTLTCNSGAINIPACSFCPGGQTLVGSMCVNNCTNGATNPTTCDACPDGQEIIDGNCKVITFCGDATCNGPETILTCPTDCKGRYQQF